MGRWDNGNLDSNSASEHLGLIMDFLVTQVRACFTGIVDEPGVAEPFEALMATIDVIIVLCQHYNTRPWIENEIISAWRKRCMEIFDADFQSDDPILGDIERRKVVEETLNKLESIVLDRGDKNEA